MVIVKLQEGPIHIQSPTSTLWQAVLCGQYGHLPGMLTYILLYIPDTLREIPEDQSL